MRLFLFVFCASACFSGAAYGAEKEVKSDDGRIVYLKQVDDLTDRTTEPVSVESDSDSGESAISIGCIDGEWAAVLFVEDRFLSVNDIRVKYRFDSDGDVGEVHRETWSALGDGKGAQLSGLTDTVLFMGRVARNNTLMFRSRDHRGRIETHTFDLSGVSDFLRKTSCSDDESRSNREPDDIDSQEAEAQPEQTQYDAPDSGDFKCDVETIIEMHERGLDLSVIEGACPDVGGE